MYTVYTSITEYRPKTDFTESCRFTQLRRLPTSRLLSSTDCSLLVGQAEKEDGLFPR